MEKYNQSERTFLFLAVIAGLSGFATLETLFSSVTSFTIFPLLALGLALYCIYQQHSVRPMTEGTPILAFACFLVGGFGYSAFSRMETPELGGNFLSILLCMGLLFWVFFKTGWLSVKSKEEISS
jgi:nitrate reductase NapE component